ncbi:hypothetical protein LIA77_03286 [Sarocladium implicatum]|nr:hypothetical protein LIA77_03286 [Sarocladium implicatum]
MMLRALVRVDVVAHGLPVGSVPGTDVSSNRQGLFTGAPVSLRVAHHYYSKPAVRSDMHKTSAASAPGGQSPAHISNHSHPHAHPNFAGRGSAKTAVSVLAGVQGAGVW